MRKILTVVLCLLVFSSLASLQNSLSKENSSIQIKKIEKKPLRPNLNRPSPVFLSSGTQNSKHVGREVLERGGSAVDAALASALARIVEDMGCIVSYAGIFMMVYYEASTGKVYSLNACFKVPEEETESLTIPYTGIPNARGVLVPGFMAGIQSAHNRFGTLPFSELFLPAINLAEQGFILASWHLAHIRNHWHILGVLPESRNIFLKRRYGLFRNYQTGDLFTQPELAHTLRQVAAHGSDYMYSGAWGRKLVDTLQSHGGNMIYRDLGEYEPVWSNPMHTTYNGYDVYALGNPSLGASMVVLSINLMECANLTNFPHVSQSAEALYRLIYCSRIPEFFYPPYAPEIINSIIPGGNFSYATRADKHNAQLIWNKVLNGDWGDIERQIRRDGWTRPAHSEDIIAVDNEGNVAVVCHTINTDLWGNSGIFIDGVSVPAAAYFQREWVSKVGPGGYLPDTTNPIMILRNGLPAVASSCIGSDLHSATVQNLYNMLHFNMSMSQSRATPKFQSLDWNTLRQKVLRGAFSQQLIETVQAKGIQFTFVEHGPSEYWIGLRFDYPEKE